MDFGGTQMFGGGGYMPTQAEGAGASPQNRKPGAGMQTITPVTLNMLNKATTNGVDDTLRVDGVEVHNVSTFSLKCYTPVFVRLAMT